MNQPNDFQSVVSPATRSRVEALAGVLERVAPRSDALDVARNCAQAVLLEVETLGQVTLERIGILVWDAMEQGLRHRRDAFPSSPWASLNDPQIAALTFDASCAWVACEVGS